MNKSLVLMVWSHAVSSRSHWRPSPHTGYTLTSFLCPHGNSKVTQIHSQTNGESLLFFLYVITHVFPFVSLQQKPPSGDWRFTQNQRPGPSGWVTHTHTHTSAHVHLDLHYVKAESPLFSKTFALNKWLTHIEVHIYEYVEQEMMYRNRFACTFAFV